MRSLTLFLWALAAVASAQTLSPMPTARYGLSAVLAGGRLYAIGGDIDAQSTGALERYDPSTDRWERLAPMPTPRSYFAAAAVGGKIYALGGFQNGSPGQSRDDTVEVYDLKTGRWSQAPPMPRACDFCRAAVVDEEIFVVGGRTRSDIVPTVSIFDTRSGNWREAPAMATPRAIPGLAVLDDRIWAVGGTRAEGSPPRALPMSSAESFNLATRSWRLEQGLLWAGASNAEAAGGRLYALGGSDGKRADIASMAFYDGDHWQDAPPMPTGRSSFASASDGVRIFAVGGSPGRNISYDTLEIFDTRAGTWRTSGPPKPKAVASAEPAPLIPAMPPRAEPARSYADDLPAPRAVKTRADDFALVIGLEDYRSVMAAQYGREDAEAFARYATARLGVPAENVITLTGQRATKTDIEKYVEEWLPRNVEKGSRVFVYYSGHGAPDPEKGDSYLLPWDGDPQFLQSSGYPLTRLYAKLAALPARHVVVFLDACFSGAGGRSVIAKNLRPLVQAHQTPLPKGRLTILSASSATQVAGGFDAKRHGLFSYYLLRGLSGEASKDGHLDVSSLYGFVRNGVRKQAHRENREQDPQLQTSEPALRLY
jgi:hypothetical protein